MAKYPIKMLKDEEGNAFVPLTSSEALKTPDGKTLDEKLQNKLETTNIKAGTDINITVDGNNVTINNASKGVLIDNLTTETPGVGSLDAHQGKVLKEMIPEVVNNVTSTDSDKALSAYQGYLLSGKVVPTGGKEGQVLKKSSDTNWSLEWGDAADPNAIVGDGSIKKIIELTYEEYQALETIDPDTEYHIVDAQSTIDELQATLDNLQLQITALKNSMSNIDHQLSNNFSVNTDIPLNTNFTCTTDGIVQFGGYGPTFVELDVNGQAVEMLYCGNQAYHGVFNSYRVKKGDIVKITYYEGQESYANVHVFKAVLDKEVKVYDTEK